MVCARRILADEKLLVELFAWAQPAISDLDIALRIGFVPHFETRKADHGAGQIVDLHRRSHLQDENLAAFRHGSGLDDELRGFRDRHEIADDFRMGHGDGAARLDLVSEQPDDRAGRIQDVAEAHHREDRFARFLRHGLKDELGEALARAHDIGRPYGLVA